MKGSIVKRGKKSWAAVVYVGKDPDTGKDRQKWYTHKTEGEAEAHLTTLLGQLTGGGTIPNTKLKVGEFLDQWLEKYAAGAVGPTTLRSYQDTVKKHLKPELGLIPLMRLSPAAIQGYFTQKLKEERIMKKSKKRLPPLSPSTVQRHAMLLHEALRHAVKWGYLIRNPADMADPPAKRQTEMRVWDEKQVQCFLEKAKASPYYRLYLAAITTGMRQGELLGLRWSDVDLSRSVARIQQTFYRLAGKMIWKEPKTKKSRRSIDLSPVLVEELLSLREDQNDHRRLFGDQYEEHDLIFCQVNGKPLHAHNVVRRDFCKVIGAAKLPRIRFHDLRHCHATLMLSCGTHLKVVQERLGHCSIRVTGDIYSHVLPGMQRQAVSDFDARLFSVKADRPLAGVSKNEDEAKEATL